MKLHEEIRETHLKGSWQIGNDTILISDELIKF